MHKDLIVKHIYYADIEKDVSPEQAFYYQMQGWNNLVGIHIFQRQWHTSAGYDIKFLFHTY